MGTVPDPLRSARHLPVATPEEKNGLGEPPSSKHHSKQASIEKNDNGFPPPAQVQPAGDYLLDGSCAVVTDEQRCGHDTNQLSMFSRGSFSPSKEGTLAVLKPASSSEQESSNGSRDPAVVESCTPVQMAVKRPATQEATEIMQSGDGGHCCKAIVKANSAPGDGVEGNEAHESVSACLQSAAQEASLAVKEVAGKNTGPDRTPLLVRESKAVPDLEVKSPVCLGAELLEREDASPCPSAEVVPETVLKPSLQSTPQPSCNTETEGKAVAERKDTGTMTTWTDSRSVAGEVEHKGHQDAEVQAVATVENKSICTSPSILAAFLRRNMQSETKGKEEQLHVIYAGAAGREQSEIVDGCAPLLQTVPSVGKMPDVHIQAPAAGDALGTQAVRLQGDPRGMHGTICIALLDDGKPPCLLISGSAQETSASGVEAQRASGAGSHGDISQQPSDGSGLLTPRPVFQITVNSCDQPGSPPQPVNIETELPPPAVLSVSNSKHQDPRPSVGGSNQASPTCRRVSEQVIRTGVSTPEGKEGPHLPIQAVSDPKASPGSSQKDVKPKREEKVISLHPKEQEMNKAGAAAGPQTGRSPGIRKREHYTFPEQDKEAKLSGSQNLVTGPEPECCRTPTPDRRPQGAKGSGIRKEATLDKTAASAQHRLNLSGKKEKPEPATEARVQLKQSKRVRDVVWDEQGMTWEVYGASLDPESLGIAIQNHLQRQIREHEKLLKSQSTQNRKSISSDTSSTKKLKGRQHSVFQSMLQNFRRPNCCVRPTASSVLD